MRQKIRNTKKWVKSNNITQRLSRVKDYVLGLFKISLGIIVWSFVPIVYGLFTLSLGFSKEVYLTGVRKSKYKEIDQVKYYFLIATFILITNVLFVGYMCSFFLIKGNLDIGLIPSLILAMIAFTELVTSIIKMFKNSKTLLDKGLLYIELTSAFASIVFTQMALLSVTEPTKDLSNSNGFAGCFFGSLSILVALKMYYKCYKLRSKK